MDWMDEDGSRPNWVEARANCTIFGTFAKIDEAVRHDVSCFNRLPPDSRSGRQYDCHESGAYALRVTNNYNRDEVLIKLNTETVEILANRVVQFVVCQKWNEETLTCDLTIDGSVTCPWKVSQKAIGDFMFA